MTNATADTVNSIASFHAALNILNSLNLACFRYPAQATLTNLSYYDYIIVGGGAAGSVLAYRLSADSNNKVLLIEEGTCPPLESEMGGLFTPMPTMSYDYNIPSVNNAYTAQNLVGGRVDMTQGKMLGGSGKIEHMIYTRGNPNDYNQWAAILDDDSWTYENVLSEFVKIENIMNGTANYCAVEASGMVKLTQDLSSENIPYFQAYENLNYTIINGTDSCVSSLGASNPFYGISDEKRYDNAFAYLTLAKSRSNLNLTLSTKATKILIEDSKAVGVQVVTSSSETLLLYANKEVIVTAGALHTPQLLMWSGIGPKEHLESLDIPVVADLPVGQNLMDHPSAVVLVQTTEDTSDAAATNPYLFPVPTITAYAAINSSQDYPDYQTINLLFPHDSSGLMQLCVNVFKYSSDICNAFAAANVNRKVIFFVHNLMMPKSRGNLTLASTDTTVEPIVHLGTYSNEDDLDLMVSCLKDFESVINSTGFQALNATIVDTGLCTGLCDDDYYKCIALSMSATMWHYSGTCAMGAVTDSKMLVKGIEALRICDASAMPTLVSGNIRGAVTMMAERCATNILCA